VSDIFLFVTSFQKAAPNFILLIKKTCYSTDHVLGSSVIA